MKDKQLVLKNINSIINEYPFDVTTMANLMDYTDTINNNLSDDLSDKFILSEDGLVRKDQKDQPIASPDDIYKVCVKDLK